MAQHHTTESCVIYTIGHSNHSMSHFVELLRGAGVNAVADVRSMPYSRRLPHFNRENLQRSLADAGIKYSFLGEELGARPRDRSCYRGGVAEYNLIAASKPFRSGLRRLESGARQYQVATMCAESDPLDCHRTILVARHLQKRGIEIRHILADGTLESNSELEWRLIKLLNLETGDLLTGSTHVSEAVREAYERRGHQIAYKEGGRGGNRQVVGAISE